MAEERLTIQQVAAQTGMSEYNLRYYEQIGLIASVERDTRSGHRRYAPEQVSWINFLACMRATGMPLEQMQQLVALAAQGATALPERRALLEDHQEAIRRQIDQLQKVVGFLDLKIAHHRVLEEHEGRESVESLRLKAQIEAHSRDWMEEKPRF